MSTYALLYLKNSFIHFGILFQFAFMIMKKLFARLCLFGAFLNSIVFAQTVESAKYGITAAGEAVTQYTLKNEHGMTVKLIDFGGIVTDIIVPDRFGNFENVTLNLPDLAAYEADKGYFGPIIGRFGNRLAKSQFKIGGETFTVPANEGQNALHGGTKGFGKFVWKSEAIKGENFAGVKLSRTSPDGEMGFPGNMNVEVTFTLNNQNEFTAEYKATSDKPTVCNLTWHPFFNLAGAGNGSILTHHFKIVSDFITMVDKELIPTGELLAVGCTPFDFGSGDYAIGECLYQNATQLLQQLDIEDGVLINREKQFSASYLKNLKSRIDKALAQLKISGGGYDHNWVLSKSADEMGVACVAYDPKSGRRMTVSTQEPGLQVYTGQGFDGTIKGANGKAYYSYAGFVIEPQHFPDAPNHESFFPRTLLVPGEIFTSKSIYRFEVADLEK